MADAPPLPSHDGLINGVPYRIERTQEQAEENQQGSFVLFGRALGPTLAHPGFESFANSPYVDLEREYQYPPDYRCILPPLALVTVAGFGICFMMPVSLVGALVASQIGLLACCTGCAFACLNVGHFFREPRSPPQPLSRTELRHLIGRTACTFWTIIFFFAGLILHMATADGDSILEGELFLMESLGAVVVLVPAWFLANRITKHPVKAGFMMSFFWSGAIFSTELAGVFNTALLLFWQSLDPTCNAAIPQGPSWPFDAPSASCVGKAALEWILTPGIVEESLKFVVLTRLVTSLEEAVNSQALTRCPRMSMWPGLPCCGWFLKLASSPALVVLAGMSAGAGFGSMENVQYIAKLSGLVKATGDIGPASVRVFTAMLHIAMTGTCAFFLAISMFSPGKPKFVKYIGWALMVLGHGTYDAFCTFQSQLDLDSCFTRATCILDITGVEICEFSKSAPLMRCLCPGTAVVNEDTRKCAVNATVAPERDDSLEEYAIILNVSVPDVHEEVMPLALQTPQKAAAWLKSSVGAHAIQCPMKHPEARQTMALRITGSAQAADVSE
ncbi:unnamed protein product [Effrenium voratum]|nr:unnamed protein product [Effrenium voratum]